MESLAVSFIQRTRERYRHCVVCLRGEGALAPRLHAVGVRVISIDKRRGKDFGAYWRLTCLLRTIAPEVVHTYNVGTVDVALWARLAGVRHVVHAEHGRDVSDPTGSNPRYRWLRRLMAPAIGRFVAVSDELGTWLIERVGISGNRTQVIRNGIDLDRFADAAESRVWDEGFAPAGSLVIGSIGRLDPVKAFDVLIEAFAHLQQRRPDLNARLVIVGEGNERSRLTALIAQRGLESHVRLMGARDDINVVLRSMDIYACSSVTEGIALTILEAMACERPVVATRVGGNPELVADGETGLMVPADDVPALASALERLADDKLLARRLGRAARARVVAEFSLETMISAYCRLYDSLTGIPTTAAPLEDAAEGS
ncbi:sugar transferase, PEP-CTERM/EpsH1 system associated protein [Salinisphaera dokdonensis CL-ES53]|uniref:Sugar transferase, PEP-CTERM/EpsH1 system associated protein n=2 Tax=Salinisphaera TaxID=180541 RepID=A0ABV2B4A0_9GAMM